MYWLKGGITLINLFTLHPSLPFCFKKKVGLLTLIGFPNHHIQVLVFWFHKQNWSSYIGWFSQSPYYSDAGLARGSTWLLWPLLRIVFNGGRLLCQFGSFLNIIFYLTLFGFNMESALLSFNERNDVIMKISWFQVILSVVELPAYIYAVNHFSFPKVNIFEICSLR